LPVNFWLGLSLPPYSERGRTAETSSSPKTK
jgi:hypothetical protein